MRRLTVLAILLFMTGFFGVASAENVGVDITGEMKSCVRDDDCVTVFKDCTECSGPENYSAINRSSKKTFDKKYKNDCVRLRTGPLYPCTRNIKVCGSGKCLSGECTFVQHECKGNEFTPNEHCE